MNKLVEYDKERKRFYLKVFPKSDIVYGMSFHEINNLAESIENAITDYGIVTREEMTEGDKFD